MLFLRLLSTLAVELLLPSSYAASTSHSNSQVSTLTSSVDDPRHGLNTSMGVSAWPPAPFTFNVQVRPRVFHKLHVLFYNPARLPRQEVVAIALIRDDAKESLSRFEPDTELSRREIICTVGSRPHRTWNPNRINLEVAFFNSDSEPGRQHTASTVWEILDLLVLEFIENGFGEGHYATLVLEILGIRYRRVQVRQRYVNALRDSSFDAGSANDTAARL